VLICSKNKESHNEFVYSRWTEKVSIRAPRSTRPVFCRYSPNGVTATPGDLSQPIRSSVARWRRCSASTSRQFASPRRYVMCRSCFSRTIAVKCCVCIVKRVQNVLWIRKRVHATVVTAGHCMHVELTPDWLLRALPGLC